MMASTVKNGNDRLRKGNRWRRSFVERDARGIVGLSEKEALRSSSPASLLSPATNGDEAGEADEADERR